jgi:hypothetical protein
MKRTSVTLSNTSVLHYLKISKVIEIYSSEQSHEYDNIIKTYFFCKI